MDTLWLGLLMVMMSIAVKILNATDSNPPDSEIGKNPIESWHAFRCAAEQCMIVGEYTKKLYLHTVQTLILLVVSTTPLESSWFFLGSVVRIAMSMGLHRDPRQFPAITQGEGELRRRLWTMITCMDLLTSIQIGLPSMIKEDECDTKMPLNLHDDEVGANVKTLPPEHDKNVLTGVSYMISKASMAHGLCEIVRQVNSVKARPPYDEILKLEADLTARYEQMPEFLLTKSVEDNVNDPAWIIIQRHNLDVLRQIAYLSLHRPYAAKARSNPRYMYSYDRCVSAAMTLLQRQEELHRQIDSTHQQAKWFSISHDGLQFLHAAMIISLDLSSPQDVPPDAVDRKRKYDALYKARKVASNTMEWNIDASRAHGVITVLLNKLESTEPLAFQERVQKYAEHQKLSAFDRRVASYASTLPDFSLSPSSTQSSPIEPLKSDQAAALTLGMMSGGGLTPNSAFASLFSDRQPVSTPGGTFHLPDAPTGTVPPPAAFSPPGWNALWNMGSGPGGFDMPQGVEWDEWDEFMKGIDLDTSQMAGFPVMPGIGLYPASAAQDRLDKRDRGGGGSG